MFSGGIEKQHRAVMVKISINSTNYIISVVFFGNYISELENS